MAAFSAGRLGVRRGAPIVFVVEGFRLFMFGCGALRLRVWGLGFRVKGLGFGVLGLRFGFLELRVLGLGFGA